VALAIAPGCKTPACTAERAQQKATSKASGETFDRLFVRHWDAWADGSRNRLFALSLHGDAATPLPLTPNLDGDVPSKPFGGPDDFTISPDCRSVYFSARIAGRREPWSTNFDIWRVPIDGTSEPTDLTPTNPAWDADPVVSPDGTTLAYRAQRTPGFESDRFGVWVMDLKTGARREIDPKWDRSVDHLSWSADGRSLFVAAEDLGARKLFRMDIASGAVTALSNAGHVGGYDVGSSAVVFARDTFTSPADLWMISGGAAPVQLTHIDEERLAGVSLSPAEPFSFPGWNGDIVHGNVFKPSGYQAGHKYPVAFLIHGGPQGAWDDSWSYRWNPQTYTGAGYAVVMIDFHGSTGYGQAFTDSISGHWGDRPLEDLQKGWAAALARFPWLDGNRAAALGASYGGFMIDWIAGVWNAPWKCLVVHDGVFDQRMMGYASDEMWFTEWENGRAMPWKNPEGFERFNPIDHVAQWTKPLLVIHGGKDFRIPLEQGLAAFAAAQSRNVPSRLLYFPDENHWVLKPRNSLQWHATVQAWLDQWLSKREN
jgi:acylaminoacyl-peptidase